MLHEEKQNAWRRGWVASQNYALPRRRGPWRKGGGGDRNRVSGQSLDFNDHRPYVQGDDMRLVNWRVYAATGQMVLKTFEEEVSPCADILIDGSQSMFYVEEKAIRSIEMIGWIVGSCQRQGLRPNLMVMKNHGVENVEFFSEEQCPNIFNGVACSSIDLSHIPWRRNSLRVFLSDLLYPGDPLEWLRPLAKGAGLAWLYCPYDESESNPEWSDDMEMEDVESGNKRRISLSSDLLKRYRLAYERHTEEAESTCTRLGVFFNRVNSQLPWSKVLPSLGEDGAQWVN
ncbi:MAG: DUF58 domain-containing protein [Planctomycetes bacterium]|nr:DUF58 domain-containing protein [Planctomycetota bacterium]